MFACLPSERTLLFWSDLFVVGRVVGCERWEISELGRWERWEGSEYGRWERWEGRQLGRWKRWDGSEVASLERWEGSDTASWERWEDGKVARWESSEVARREVNGYIQGWIMQGESKISSSCF